MSKFSCSRVTDVYWQSLLTIARAVFQPMFSSLTGISYYALVVVIHGSLTNAKLFELTRSYVQDSLILAIYAKCTCRKIRKSIATLSIYAEKKPKKSTAEKTRE